MKQKWEYKKLGDACRDVTDFVAAGSFADLRKNVVYNSEPDFAQLIRTTDLKRKFTNSDYVYVSKSAFEYLWRVNLDKACIILPNVGNCGEVYYVSPNDLPYENNVLGPNAVLVRSYTENQRFLAYAFKGNDFQSQLKSIVGTVAQPKFNKTNLKNLTVPVPPMDEQQRIVAELDLLTEVIDKQKTQLKELDTLAQSIFYDMFGDPTHNEKGWDVKKLENVVANEKYALKAGPFGSALKKEFYKESGYKIYGQEQVIANDVSVGNYYIDESKYQELKSCSIKEDDVLISLVGTFGKILIVPKQFEPGIINPRLIKISFDGSIINTTFFKSFFSCESSQQMLKTMIHGQTMGVLNLGILRQMRIPIPPLAIQQEFADKIQSIEKQKAAINQSIANTQKLLDYTMDKYFG